MIPYESGSRVKIPIPRKTIKDIKTPMISSSIKVSSKTSSKSSDEDLSKTSSDSTSEIHLSVDSGVRVGTKICKIFPFTWQYTGASIGTSQTNKCIILDVDETLACSFDKPFTKRISDPSLRDRIYHIELVENDHTDDINIHHMWGITRPHLDQFLKFCFNYFKIVAVCSAGSYDYVHEVVNNIFRHVRRPHLIFTRDDCSTIRPNNIIKPLENIIKAVPGLADYMNMTNTLVIDNLPSTFSRNQDNGVHIPDFDPVEDKLDIKDDYLLDLISWLSLPDVIKSDDVRTLDKTKIFSS